ncbi:MAG TPA: preprotein translocase subunit SecE, partial [Micromonosporaceae bacterium]
LADADFESDDEADDAATRRSSARAGVVSPRRPAPRAKPREGAGRGLFARIGHFVKEVVAELQKVIWPTRKELLTYTAVVVVFVTFMMTVVALLDLAFAKGMFLVFGGKAGS